jgi:hypothetical protein
MQCGAVQLNICCKYTQEAARCGIEQLNCPLTCSASLLSPMMRSVSKASTTVAPEVPQSAWTVCHCVSANSYLEDSPWHERCVIVCQLIVIWRIVRGMNGVSSWPAVSSGGPYCLEPNCSQRHQRECPKIKKRPKKGERKKRKAVVAQLSTVWRTFQRCKRQ